MSVSQFSHTVMSNSLQPHGLQHTRPPCLSPTPGIYPNSCPLSQWCHQTISSSVAPFSSCLPSFPASGSFPISQFFVSGGQRIGASASASELAPRTGKDKSVLLQSPGVRPVVTAALGSHPSTHGDVLQDISADKGEASQHPWASTVLRVVCAWDGIRCRQNSAWVSQCGLH